MCALISTPERMVIASADEDSKDCLLIDDKTLFFDPGSQREGPKQNVLAFTKVFASAHGKNLGSLRKSPYEEYCVPAWSLDELKECKDLCYRTASINVEGLHKK